MKNYPPKCSKEWTAEERLRLAAWIVALGLDAIERDNPNMPVVAKVPMYENLKAVYFVLAKPAEILEENRALLEKPSDTANDYHMLRERFGGGFTLSRPQLANVPEGNAGWELVKCPYCQCQCWKTPFEPNPLPPNTIAACSACAIKRGSHQAEMDAELARRN